jgi:hypothetical protein
MDFGSTQTPFLGGPSIRVNRLGMRFAARVSFPPLRSDAEGLIFISRLLQARADELLLDCPLVDGSFVAMGASKVKVAATGGTTLQIKGMNVGASAGEGRIFHVMHGGRPWLHMLSAGIDVDGSGEAVSSIWPPLRTAVSVNDVISFDAPKMQGHVVDERLAWDMALARRTSLNFTVEESQ